MINTSPKRRLIISRKRCKSLITKIKKEVTFYVIQYCNICGSKENTILSVQDRYGLPIRTTLCDKCGLIYLIDRPDQHGYKLFYAKYYRLLVSAYWGSKVNNKQIVNHQIGFTEKLKVILKGLIDFEQKKSLLDIGGSTGMIAYEFAQLYDLEATVLDPSEEELRIAESKGLETVCGFIEDYEPNHSFDIILFLQTIDHVMDLKKTLKQITSMLSDDGIFIVDTVNLPTVITDQTNLVNYFKIDHCYYFTNEFARSLLESSGLKILYTDIASWPGHSMFVCQKMGTFEPENTRVDIRKVRENFIQNIEYNFYLQNNWKDNIITLLARFKKRIIK